MTHGSRRPTWGWRAWWRLAYRGPYQIGWWLGSRPLTLTFLRGFAIVTVTALNVSLIADRNLRAAFVAGAVLSWIWWGNAQAAQDRRGAARACYALGAGLGTVAGIMLAELIGKGGL
jgi:hypothetical protein